MDEFIADIMNKTNIHGRIVYHTSGKVVIYDCPHWSNKASSLVHFQKPNVVISVEQCMGSLSGYIVILEEKTINHAQKRFCIALFIGFLLFSFIYVIDMDIISIGTLHYNVLIDFIYKWVRSYL
jgi:hypothetical protein